ncbi:MAG TPA: histidine--tRNA ligase [Acidimicrobiales bacterium]|jgi:histidyl-tRNA synthetase|nr:histidine--tRNA ligase [Acidimicrobiales bacterium]
MAATDTSGSDARANAPRTPKGMHDVLWPESARWEDTVARFATIVQGAGYGLAVTPVLEHVGVFHRGIGEASDVVGKEMYTFADRDGQVMALRPEGTASIVRAFVQHHPTPPWKSWYLAPLFRHENPQHGRYRQHYQLGVEAIGPADADLDVEVITLAQDFLTSFGLRDFTLKLHSMGDAECRPAYLDLLRAYLDEHQDEMCDAHRLRYRENPLRVLDCKTPECRAVTEGAPHFVDHLCGPCAEHLARVRAGLEALGVPYVIDFRLVRGFDYYTRTTFEFASGAIDAAQNAIGGGGRYDGLVEMLGGPATPGIGFGIGVERLLIVCDAEGVFPTQAPALDAFVIDLTGGAEALALTAELRRAGLRVDRAFDHRSMKSQIKSADRSGAEVALVIGAEELATGTVGFRTLRDEADQRTVPRADVVAELRAHLINNEPPDIHPDQGPDAVS